MTEETRITIVEDQLKEAYLDYSMSVIVGRALPDIRDGLKPVHRRILYSMSEMGLTNNKPFVKSARIVGDCFKYHPHGDAAIYDSLVRMVQSFSLRYPLVAGHGNFGSADYTTQASLRYTEAKLAKIGEELLFDIDKDTVDFVPNFDGSMKEPALLPSRVPNLLLNGSSGIAVGMATNIPPHNLSEIVSGIIAFIDNNEINVEELMNYIKGPDFPTGGIIVGAYGIKSAYKTGRGKLLIRSKIELEEKRIVVKEIPYQVNKTQLIEGIVELINNKVVEGISDIRDESDKTGMSLIIEIKKGFNPETVLNQLYKHSQLQTTFGVIMLALDGNQPKIFNLKEAVSSYIFHRKEIVTRRTKFELKKAEDRLHILEGLLICLKNIDAVVALIKKSKDPAVAKHGLMNNYELTEIQAQAILDLKLQRLTSLEQNKINIEHDEIVKLVIELKDILAKEPRIYAIIKDELLDIKNRFGDERRTEIIERDSEPEANESSLINEEDVVVTITNEGYIKQTSLELYKQQKRGGKGIIATTTKEEDIVQHLFITSNHNYLLFFTNKGKLHWLKVYQVQEASRYSKGKAIVNLLNLKDEKISAVLPIAKFDSQQYLLFATKKGILKKTSLEEYSRPRQGGIAAINLKENDDLVQVRLTPGNLDMVLATKKGLAMRFNETDVNPVGRNASGVIGIRLENDDEVIGLEVALKTGNILTVTENGYGKRTEIGEYRHIRRGGKGVINIQTSERNGDVVGIKTVKDNDEIMLISKNGVIIRVPVSDISIVGRNTQGVRIMKLDDKDKVKTIARVITENNHNGNGNNGNRYDNSSAENNSSPSSRQAEPI
ncbi:DNA gyrase subunit A [Candidatus Woesearchaeota archaeon]|nr:DNA gyrase subunit A [Candidatus Woesearchaeota archaeon]